IWPPTHIVAANTCRVTRRSATVIPFTAPSSPMSVRSGARGQPVSEVQQAPHLLGTRRAGILAPAGCERGDRGPLWMVRGEQGGARLPVGGPAAVLDRLQRRRDEQQLPRRRARD